MWPLLAVAVSMLSELPVRVVVLLAVFVMLTLDRRLIAVHGHDGLLPKRRRIRSWS
jgi:hypothetical protein